MMHFHILYTATNPLLRIHTTNRLHPLGPFYSGKTSLQVQCKKLRNLYDKPGTDLPWREVAIASNQTMHAVQVLGVAISVIDV